MKGLGEIFSGYSLPIKSDALDTMSWDIWSDIQEYYEPKIDQGIVGEDISWSNHLLSGVARVRSE